MKALCPIAALSAAMLLASCSLTQQQVKDGAQASADAAQAAEAAPASTAPDGEPTAEQQAAAEKLLAEQAAPIPEPTAADTPPEALEDAAPALSPLGGGLRMGSIAPKEDPASTAEGTAPAANSVELRGLRSPKFPKGLPMDIDGKLTGQN